MDDIEAALAYQLESENRGGARPRIPDIERIRMQEPQEYIGKSEERLNEEISRFERQQQMLYGVSKEKDVMTVSVDPVFNVPLSVKDESSRRKRSKYDRLTNDLIDHGDMRILYY